MNTCFFISILTCLALFLGQTAQGADAAPMTNLQKQKLRKYQNMTPPNEMRQHFIDLNNVNTRLRNELLIAEKQYASLHDGTWNALENDVAFYEARIESLENDRQLLLEEIKNTQGAVAGFSMALNSFLLDRIGNKNYVPFGLPVFPRRHVFKQEPADGRCIIVDVAHPVQKNLVAIGGEIIAKGKGSVQFLVLHKELDKWKVTQVGERITITEDDKLLETPGVYQKYVVFEKNYAQVEKGDCYGVVIDNEIGITYDSVGTSSSIVLPVENDSIPELVELSAQDDMVKLKPSGTNDKWKRFSPARNEGKAFSFNLIGEVIE